jgi:predicted alpha/beta-fold hydrolase
MFRFGRKISAGLLLGLSALFAAAADSAEKIVPASTTEPQKTAGPDIPGLPPYQFGYDDGLYATIAGYLSIKDPDIKNLKSLKLKVPGFRKKMPVRAIIQPQEAPLVVVLLGLDGRADGPLGKLWPSWFGAAGCHVLTCDSTFRAQFVEISGHGVTGNLPAETEQVAKIIEAFLEQSDVRGRVTKIGVVGLSYGGIEALLLGQMAAANKLPFKLDAVQAYSPPVNLSHTGNLIDRWYREDRWDYTLVELANKFADHKPVPPGSPVPFDHSLMRAGIAAVFRLGLAEVIFRNNEAYKLGLLPEGNQFNEQYVKQEYAKLWSFDKFLKEMSFPYWQQKAGLKDLAELTGPVQLSNLVQKQILRLEVIVAEDDPLNTPEDMATFKTAAKSYPVIILPRGGHLGYVSNEWTKAMLLSLFKNGEHASNSPQPPK